MQKKYIVKLTPKERAELVEVVRKLKGYEPKSKARSDTSNGR